MTQSNASQLSYLSASMSRTGDYILIQRKILALPLSFSILPIGETAFSACTVLYYIVLCCSFQQIISPLKVWYPQYWNQRSKIRAPTTYHFRVITAINKHFEYLYIVGYSGKCHKILYPYYDGVRTVKHGQTVAE
jgi:hypothetical protein